MKALWNTFLIRQATSLAFAPPISKTTGRFVLLQPFIPRQHDCAFKSRTPNFIQSHAYSSSSSLHLKLSPEEIAASLGPDRIIASKPFTWDQLQQIVQHGDPTMHSRSMEVQEQYVLHSREIKQEWQSMNDYILYSKFGFDKVYDSSVGSYAAHPSLEKVISDSQVETQLLLNEYPYYVDTNIEHWCLWKLGGKVSQEEIDFAVEELKNDATATSVQDVLTWVNPPHLQSIPDIDHAHLLCLRSGDIAPLEN